jgi:cbb3-type cytochrome oxidase cytochrome c subunit
MTEDILGGRNNGINRNMKWGLLGSVVVICGIIFLFTQGSPNGAELFRSQGCIGCHSFKGKGGETCPDLTAVTQRRSDGWIRQQLKDSKKHYPNSGMPGFGHLSYREISAIIRYLKS